MSRLRLVEVEEFVDTYNGILLVTWITYCCIHVLLFCVLVLPRCSCIHCTDKTRTRIRDATALWVAMSSILLIALLGIDQGFAKFTRTSDDAWHLLVASGLYHCHGF